MAGKDGAGFELVIWDRPIGQSPLWKRVCTAGDRASPSPSLSLHFFICQMGSTFSFNLATILGGKALLSSLLKKLERQGF